MLYLWLKAFHIIAIVAWFAALFYLPRLFVYHAMPENKAPGSGWLRWGDAIAAGQKAREAQESTN